MCSIICNADGIHRSERYNHNQLPQVLGMAPYKYSCLPSINNVILKSPLNFVQCTKYMYVYEQNFVQYMYTYENNHYSSQSMKCGTSSATLTMNIEVSNIITINECKRFIPHLINIHDYPTSVASFERTSLNLFTTKLSIMLQV